MNYRELYAALSQHELRNVAARARLSVEDVRQEAWLCCWQIASGRSDYDARRGTVRQYLMAKLWGFAAREIELPTVSWRDTDEDEGDGAPRARIAAAHSSPSVLDAIIGREDRREEDQCLAAPRCDARRRYVGVSSIAVLMDQGISSGRIASLTGVTPQAVRQRVARERARGGRGVD
ncbi:MAG TPA: hypothetical protein VNE82_00050 [Candidatus Binataceae bacterium]|nr:hypothetical protein [Candidatus Binataceae bacterium]